MSLLKRPEAQALLADAKLTARTVQGCQDRLTQFLQRYLPLFQRQEQREHAETVLAGKLSHLDRKTCEPIARERNLGRHLIQHFVGCGEWDNEAVMSEVRRHVAEHFADSEATLVIDGSSFPKKGTESCGVARQWCGRLGKTDNCQVGVFTACVSRGRTAPLDRQLYLSKEWAKNSARRHKCHVPKSVKFAPKWRIALRQLKRASRVPHRFTTADDEFGRVKEFRETLRKRGETYVVDVPCNTQITIKEGVTHPLFDGPVPKGRPRKRKRPPIRPSRRLSVSQWAAEQPTANWQRLTVRGGELGPLRVDVLHADVKTDPDTRERLLVIRTVESSPRTHYCLSNASAETPVSRIVAAHDDRHRVEEMFEKGNGEVGLDHYEVRSWVGWHHHMTLSLLALWFLVLECDRVEKKDAGHHGAPSPRDIQPAATTTATNSRDHRQHDHTSVAT